MGVSDDTSITESLPFLVLKRVLFKMALFPVAAFAIKRGIVALGERGRLGGSMGVGYINVWVWLGGRCVASAQAAVGRVGQLAALDAKASCVQGLPPGQRHPTRSSPRFHAPPSRRWRREDP